MVYIASWQEYQEAAENLYAKSPNKARYCIKWRSSEGKLVLKITDDTTCIKFKTFSSIFLNRFEALNLSLMQKMQNRRPELTTTMLTSSQLEAGGETGKPRPASPMLAQQAGPSTGGVKKKKPKKKK